MLRKTATIYNSLCDHGGQNRAQVKLTEEQLDEVYLQSLKPWHAAQAARRNALFREHNIGKSAPVPIPKASAPSYQDDTQDDLVTPDFHPRKSVPF